MKYNYKNIQKISEITGHKTKMTAERYNKEISALFSEWKSSVNTNNTPFITDGVVDPEKWFEKYDRILFVLKEAYSKEPNAKDWDLINDHLLTDEPLGKSPTWRNISLWTKGLLCPEADYEPKDVELECFGNKYLHSIAAINIKKYNGKSKSNDSEIAEYAIKEKEYIKKEIELCDPNLIICCGTANSLCNVIDFDYEHKNDQWFYRSTINGHEVIVIDFYHPANQFPKMMNYFTLCSIYQRAKRAQVKRIKEL